jgi:HEAT repeat protein
VILVALLALTGCPQKDPMLAEADSAMARAKGAPVPTLFAMLKEEDAHGSAEFAAIYELSHRGAAVVPDLLEGLKSPDEAVRTGCASALGAMRNPRPKTVIPQLVPVLSDPENRTRGQAAWALGEIGVADPNAVAALTSLASSTDPQCSNTTREAKESLEKIRGVRKKTNPD